MLFSSSLSCHILGPEAWWTGMTQDGGTSTQSWARPTSRLSALALMHWLQGRGLYTYIYITIHYS